TEMDIAVVGAGVSLTVDGAGTITAARVGLGAVAARVLLVAEAAQAIIGSRLDEAAQERLSAAARAACRPIDDKRWTTEFRIEGMATGETLHPLQQQFLKSAALQCGICTPGFLVASKALLERMPNPTETEVRYWLAGNLCRCTGYDKIVSAVMDTAATMRKG